MKTKTFHQPTLSYFAAKASLLTVFAIGVLTFLEWITGLALLNSLFASYEPMKLTTALLLVLSSLSLWELLRQSRWSKPLLQMTGGITLLVSFLTLLTYQWGHEMYSSVPLQHFFFLQQQNRMAFITTVIFVFLSLILVLLAHNSRTQDNIAHVLFFPTTILSYFVLSGYVLDVAEIFRVEGINIAPLSAFSLFLLCIVTLLLRQETWLMRIIAGSGPGSLMGRRLLPWLLLLPIVIAWARIKAHQQDFFPIEIGVILVAISSTIAFLFLVGWSACVVNRIDEKRGQVHDALGESKARLNALIRATSDGVYRMSPDWKQMIGMEGGNFLTSVESPVEDWLNHFIPKDTQPVVLETIHRAITTKSKFELEHKVIRQDGSIGWTLSRAIPVLDKSGAIVEWMGIAHDFTDRKNTETALQQSEELFSKAFRQIPVPAIITRVSDNIMTHVNNSFLTLFNYSLAEVIGHTTKELNLFTDYEQRMKALEILLKEDFLQDYEFEMRTKTGKKLTLLLSSVFVKIRDERHVLTTYYDITERKETERKMGQLSAIIQHSALSVISINLKGIIQTWNEGAEKVYGYRAEEVIGENISILIPPGEKDLETLIHQVLKVGKMENPEIHRLRKDGTLITVSMTLSPIRDASGEIIAISSISNDISAHKKMEEALRAKERDEYARKGAEKALFKLNEELRRSNQELQQFAYLASHDLQEPLRKISTFTQFLAQRYKGHFDQEGEQFMDYIVENAHQMKGLISDLLTYSMIGSRMSPFAEVDVNRVLVKVVQSLEPVIQKKNAVVTCDKLPCVLGDEIQIYQLLLHLVDNSLKFCKATPVVVLSAKEQEDHYLFSISDNGIGIDQRYGEKIFLIFQRLVDRHEYKGTGIGLAVSKRIVERHGGNIWFESIVGRGTTFYFTIAKTHDYQLFTNEAEPTLSSSEA